MTDVLLAPHSDDEVLFATFTLLRHRPHVIICLADARDPARRELESAAALEVLGLPRPTQWPYPESPVPWAQVRNAIDMLPLEFDNCYAPEPRWERNGNPDRKWPVPGDPGVWHHDAIGQLALDAFGPERCTRYLTYTRWGGRDTDGNPVEPPAEWVEAKLLALACYRSQIANAAARPHFLDRQHEYVAA